MLRYVGLDLPDPDDRHVLAAAICTQAGVIVTYNRGDFPIAALEPYGIEAQHPDEFIRHVFDLSPAAVCQVVREQRAAWVKPPRSSTELLATFLSGGLPSTVTVLEEMQSLL